MSESILTTVVKSGTTVNYTYDFAHRIAKRSVGVLATRYIYDQNWNVLAEINSTGATTRLYLHGPSVDEVLAQVSGGGATVDYLLKDHLGSTTALYRPGSGVQQRFTYDEYGAVQVRDAAGNPSAAAPATRYLFTGREFDVATGLYHYRHRWYHPEIGRFVSPDPIGFEGEDINTSAYARSNPVIYSDFLGLGPEVPTYEDPGTHPGTKVAPNGNSRPDPRKQRLPGNAEELFKKSCPDPANPDRKRWTKEGTGKNVVWHRFQSSTPGKFHWNGSTDPNADRHLDPADGPSKAAQNAWEKCEADKNQPKT